MSQLNELAEKYRVDKLGWGYLPIYEQEIFKISPGIRLMEIGVRRDCRSLRMWRDYFPYPYIVGLDIKPVDQDIVDQNHFHMYCGNQADSELLSRICSEQRSFDYIIDDGSHVGDDIIASFEKLFHLVRPEGYYIIEDLHHSYYYPSHKSIFHFLRHLSEAISMPYYEDIPVPFDRDHYDRILKDAVYGWYHGVVELRDIVESVTIKHGLAIIKRKS